MPLRGTDAVAFAFICMQLTNGDVQVLLYSGDFTMEALSDHFRRLIVGDMSGLDGASQRCGYWTGPASCFCIVFACMYIVSACLVRLHCTEEIYIDYHKRNYNVKVKLFMRIVGLEVFGWACTKSLNPFIYDMCD
jgi:hypothetical protein